MNSNFIIWDYLTVNSVARVFWIQPDPSHCPVHDNVVQKNQ